MNILNAVIPYNGSITSKDKVTHIGFSKVFTPSNHYKFHLDLPMELTTCDAVFSNTVYYTLLTMIIILIVLSIITLYLIYKE